MNKHNSRQFLINVIDDKIMQKNISLEEWEMSDYLAVQIITRCSTIFMPQNDLRPFIRADFKELFDIFAI